MSPVIMGLMSHLLLAGGPISLTSPFCTLVFPCVCVCVCGGEHGHVTLKITTLTATISGVLTWNQTLED